MKKTILPVIVLLLLWSSSAFAQLKLGSNPTTIQKSSILELESGNQGLLLSRISDTTAINALNPPDGMVIFFTGTRHILVRSNGYWQSLTPTGALQLADLGDVLLSSPANGQLLKFNGIKWVNFTPNFLTSIDTTDIANFYLKVRSLQSAGPGITYNNTTGVIGNTGVLSLNGNTGALTMDTAYIANFYQKVRSLFSSTAPITYANGQIGISQASSTTSGYLSAADWNTFNNKGGGSVTSVAVTPANGVSGTVSNPTTTPAISLTLGAITPSSVAATGTVTGSNISGINTGNVSLGAANGLSLAGQVLSLSTANGSTTGALTSADWSTFMSKASNSTTINTTAPLQGGGDLSANRTLSITDAAADGTTKGAATFNTADFNATAGVVGIDYTNGQAATSTTKGFLTAADWNSFNNKANAITNGNLTETGSGILTITGGSNAVLGTGTSIQVKQANTTQSGFLSSTDWNTFNNKLSSVDTTSITNFSTKVRGLFSAGTGIGYNAATGVISNNGVLSVNGNTGALTMDTGYIANFSQKVRSLTSSTAPITYSNGNIGITQATASTNGYLSSADWNTFNNKGGGSVTSVSVTTANGVSGTVTNPTTTPAISVTLGAITPTSVAATGTLSGTQLTSTIPTGTAPLVVTSTTPVANLNIGGNAATVTTNANLTGMVTSVGNATTVVTNANLTGDVTSVGNAATIANNAVTLGKMQQVATNSLLGRSTAATGNPEVINVGSGLTLSGGTLTSTGSGGTVTSTSVVTANGVSGTVATPTTTPAITLTLGAITPVSVAATGTVTGSNISGTNTGNVTLGTAGGLSLAGQVLSLGDAAADGLTKGTATFTAADFNGTAGLIAIDYTNGQAATTTTKGFLTAADWNTFNNKSSTSTTINTTSPLQGGGDLSANRTLSILDAAADGITKGAATFNAADFNAAAGVVGIDYTNGQAANTTTKGFLTAADWNTFNNKLSSVDTTSITNFSTKVRGLFSAGTGIGYNAATGVISNNGVLSVNGNTGALTMDTGYIANFSQKVRSLTSSTAPITYSNGNIGITQATASTNGYLSSTDWNTFNNKGGGSVTSVSVTTANGVSGTVTNPTTTPAISVTLGAITPTSVAATGTLSGTQLTSTVATGTAPLVVTSTTPVANLNIGGNAATVTTNANLTGMVTSVGNVTTVVTNANTTGDVTSVGNATTIANNAVTLGKMQQVSTNSLLGRSTAGTGNPEVINLGTGLTLSGGTLTAAGTGGTVTSVAVTSANGVSGTVTNPTTTPAISVTLGAITPTSVAATGTLSGTQLTSTVATGTAPLVVTSTTPVANLNIGGNAATATTATTAGNFTGTLSGDVTGTQSATAISSPTVTGKLLTGYISNPGTVAATDNILQAIQKLNGNITAGANATHTGDATGATVLTLATVNSNVGTFNNVTVNAKGLTTAASNIPYLTAETDPVVKAINGMVKSNGTTISAAVAGTDYLTPNGSAALLTGFPTLNQNTTGNAATVTTNANLTGEVTSVGNATTVTNAAVIAKTLTGFTSAPGTITASDNILQAFQKLNGNISTAASSGWSLTGNAGTTAGTNFIGTTDDVDLVVKRAGIQAGLLNYAQFNTAWGVQALNPAGTGTGNTAMGRQALFSASTGSSNTALGYQSLLTNTTGGLNVGVGVASNLGNTVGNANVSIGSSALYYNVAGSNGVAVGHYSQRYANNTATPYSNTNTSLGYQSLQGSATPASNTGIDNVAVGYQSLLNNTTGIGNTASGFQSLTANSTGNYNTASGRISLYANTTGAYNTATGVQAMANNTIGNQNTALGFTALVANVDGSMNTALGYGSMLGNTSGQSNTGTGTGVLSANTTGSNNAGIGRDALASNITGSGNSALGYKAGFTDGTTATPNNLTNSTAIGYYSQVTASNSVVLGGTGAYAANVGIGTTAPAYKLDVVGTGSFTGTDPLKLTGVQVGTVSDSVLTINAGVVKKLALSSVNNGATVSAVSVVTANGVSGTVATPTTTPAITLTLGAITPASVSAAGTITGSNLSGTNTGNVTLGTANGLSLAGQALSLGTASTSTTGALTNTDWNTFNNKANSSSVSGTTNYIAKFNSASSIANSTLQDDGNVITTNAGNGLVATGTFGVGAVPVVAAGTRLMWIPSRAAFRAGYGSTDTTLIGNYSVAFGSSNIASGANASVFGTINTASGANSIAAGLSNTASGIDASAFGFGNTASGDYSFNSGFINQSSGNSATTFGTNNIASNYVTTAIGSHTTASGSNSTALGNYVSTNNNYGSFIIGDAGTTVTSNDAMNQMKMRFSGGYKFYTDAPGTTTGIQLTPAGVLKYNANYGSSYDARTLVDKNYVDSVKGSFAGITGTTNYIAKFNSASSVANSTLQDDGNLISTNAANGLLATGNFGTGGVPAISGAGTRMMWIPSKAAFRAGSALTNGWDSTNIGNYSVAMGQSNKASGIGSTAFGTANTVSGTTSTAFGNGNSASGTSATSFGYNNQSLGNYSLTSGSGNMTAGTNATAIGAGNIAIANNSIAIGTNNIANGKYSTAIGTNVGSNNFSGSMILGDSSTFFTNNDAANQMTMRFIGGYKFYTDIAAGTGVQITPAGLVKYNANYGSGYDARTLVDKNYVDSVKATTVASGWSLTGNTGTIAGTNFIGTSDNKSLRFRSNNIERLYIDSLTGYIGINTPSPAKTLDVNGTLNVAGYTTTNGFTNNGSGQIYQGNFAVSKDGGATLIVKSASDTYIYPILSMERTRGTIASPTNVQAGDIIGGWNTYALTPGGSMGVSSFTANVEGFNGNYPLGKLNFSVNNGVDGGANFTAFTASSTLTSFNTPATSFAGTGTFNGKVTATATNPLSLFGVQAGATSDSILTIAAGIVKKLPFSSVTSGTSWGLTGNAGTTAGTNYIGTSDNTDLVFKRNGVQSGLLNLALGNTSWGESALNAATTGINNTAVGISSLRAVTSGGNNTATGYRSLYSNTTGSANTAFGHTSLFSNTTGFNNTAAGYQALSANTSGSANAGFGLNALSLNTSGASNTAVGYYAMNANTVGGSNTGIGSNALISNVAGSNGVAIGNNSQYYANNTTTTWVNTNTSVGWSSLQGSAIAANNTGVSNTVLGYQAMLNNTSGSNNTALGTGTMVANTVGYGNTATGMSALDHNTSGNYNVATGQNALTSNLTGLQNTAIGANSLGSNTASNNVAVGFNSLSNSTTASNNTAVGISSSVGNTTGSGNTAVGAAALGTNTTGSGNTALGYSSGSTDGTVSTPNNLTNATAIGYYAQVTASNSVVLGGTGTYAANVGIGNTAPAYKLDVSGTGRFNNTNPLFLNGVQVGATTDSILTITAGVVKKLAFSSVTTGSSWGLTGNAGTTAGTNFIGTTDDKDVIFKRNGVQAGLLNNALSNTSWGVGALKPSTTGGFNDVSGYYSLASNTTGSYNTASGFQSLYMNTTGLGNTAAGNSALSANIIGNFNTGVGNGSLFQTTIGDYNSAFGDASLYSNVAGSNSVAIGSFSQANANNSATLWLNTNTSVGFRSLEGSYTPADNTGIDNTALGYATLTNNTSGSGITAIGYSAGNTDGTITTPPTLINSTAIGNRAQVTANNSFVLGGTGAYAQNVGIGTTAPAYKLDVNGTTRITGNLTGSTAVFSGNVTANSDIRLKKNIQTLPSVSESLRKINAVEFDRKDINLHQVGFIAQNVQQYFPSLVTVAKDSAGTLSLNYQAMTSPLLKGWQEHDEVIKTQQSEIDALKKEMEMMKQTIEELKNMIKK